MKALGLKMLDFIKSITFTSHPFLMIRGFSGRNASYSRVPETDFTKDLPNEVESEVRRVLLYIHSSSAVLNSYERHVVSRFTTLWRMTNYDKRFPPVKTNFCVDINYRLK